MYDYQSTVCVYSSKLSWNTGPGRSVTTASEGYPRKCVPASSGQEGMIKGEQAQAGVIMQFAIALQLLANSQD
jgi:hypothetical protein